ncbi:MAG: fibronectin type III domain-containing protein [Dehalococcoidia bacterium]|nr:fibronectin type III domain-containing protein [Dehalococcoidia bacterium]
MSATALVVDGGETITLSGVVSNAPTTTWYGIADQNSSPGGLRLWEVNVTSPGQSVSLGGFSRRSFDYGVDSADGTTAYLATTEPNVPGSLRSFDPPARTLASHGDFPSGLGVVGGIATDGTVWYALDDSGDELWSLNVTTAASSTKVGDLTAGWGSPRGLATDGISWYGLDDDGDELWKLNVTTAASSTKVGDLTAGWDSPRGLATDGISWYGFDKDGGELWELNTASPGSSTEVGDMPSAFRTGNHEAAGILALGGRLRYSWSSSGGGAFGTPNATSTTWTAPAETGVEQAIELTWTATADGRAATSSVTVRVRSGFGLADFQDDGLVMDALGLIEAGPGHNLFGRAPRAESGSLNAGELGLGPDNIRITSFRTNEEGSEITLNDNHTAFRIGDYFDTGGAGDRLTMYVQTDDWLLTFPPGSIDVAGGNFARWDILDSTSQARLMGIEEHTRVILGFGRPSAVAPAIPAAPTITAASSTAVVISWVEPSDNNFAITSYDLRYREHGTSSWTDVFDHTTTSYTATRGRGKRNERGRRLWLLSHREGSDRRRSSRHPSQAIGHSYKHNQYRYLLGRAR